MTGVGPKLCAHCGTVPVALQRNVYCSAGCRVEASRKREPEVRQCPACGVEFKDRVAGGRRRVFCSKPCQYSGVGRRAGSVEVECAHCSSPFMRRRYQQKSGWGKYCSMECRNLANPRIMVDRKCGRCGAPFSAKPFFVDRGHGKFCSKECAGTAPSVKEVKRCPVCSGEFEVSPNRAHQKRYCSIACRDLRVPIGSTRSRSDGYVQVRVEAGWTLEHRLVVERRIGRLLKPEETVHHINGARDDNRPENLELWSSSHPKGQRVTDKVAWAKEILALYDPEALR